MVCCYTVLITKLLRKLLPVSLHVKFVMIDHIITIFCPLLNMLSWSLNMCRKNNISDNASVHSCDQPMYTATTHLCHFRCCILQSLLR